jgi:FtsZ-interacting cell division protein ZipA
METRLIIAYSLIAIMVAIAIFGGMWVSKKRKAEAHRTSGRGSNL